MSNYQEMSARLDVIVAELQNGQLDVDAAVKKYEEANKLIAKMESYLETAENKIEKIKATFSNT